MYKVVSRPGSSDVNSVFHRRLKEGEEQVRDGLRFITIKKRTPPLVLDGVENTSCTVNVFVKGTLNHEEIKRIMARHLGNNPDSPVHFDIITKKGESVIKYSNLSDMTDEIRVIKVTDGKYTEEINEIATFGNSLVRIYTGLHPQNFEKEAEALISKIAEDIEAQVADNPRLIPRL